VEIWLFSYTRVIHTLELFYTITTTCHFFLLKGSFDDLLYFLASSNVFFACLPVICRSLTRGVTLWTWTHGFGYSHSPNLGKLFVHECVWCRTKWEKRGREKRIRVCRNWGKIRGWRLIWDSTLRRSLFHSADHHARDSLWKAHQHVNLDFINSNHYSLNKQL